MAARKPLVIGAGNQRTELQAGDALDGVIKYVEKATEPTAADFGRPLIAGDEYRNTTNGVIYKYSGMGNWVTDNAASLSRYVPVVLRSGVTTRIAVNADGSVSAKLRNGTTTTIPLQA